MFSPSIAGGLTHRGVSTMRTLLTSIALAILVLTLLSPASAQAPREDAIWARTYDSPITLDGVLDEGGWARAESVIIIYGVDAGIPGSGWKAEAGQNLTDLTHATLKFLVHDNQLYLGAVVPDSSVGGSREFNRFDGFLMAIKDHLDPGAPKPPAEYFYAWWYAESEDPQPAGQDPAFIGRWAEWPPGTPRTQEQIDAWDAVTVVNGLSNDDSVLDQGYTVEMRFDLTPMGYDVTQEGGDIVEWNIGIYDCDWFWPFDGPVMGTNRVWLQCPWGNAAWFSEVRIHADPTVGIFTDVLPTIGPEFVVPNGANETTPVIDGELTDSVWNLIRGFDIRYGDQNLRTTYSGVGQYRAGQFQPEVNGGLAAILDPADATVKIFFKDDILYFGFNVRDQVVQFHPDINRWDGFIVTMNDRVERAPDHNLLPYRLTFQVGANGEAVAHDNLLAFVEAENAEVAIALRPGTEVDTLGQVADFGFTAEMAIDLTSIGYPSGLGDGTVFLGVDLLDGDSFIPPSDSYGTRTWWYREYEGECCAAWGYLDPSLMVAGVEDDAPLAPQLSDVHPNPFRSTAMLQYSLADTREVTLEIFDAQGRRIERRPLGLQQPGARSVDLDGSDWSAGIYMYRLSLIDPASGEVSSSLTGRMVQLK